MSEWTEEKKLWIWRSGVILDEGMVSDLVSGVLWPEPCRRWVRWTEEEKLWIWRSGVILDEGMVSDLVSGVLWPEPCRRRVSELKRRSCESEDLEWFWMKEWSLISGQVFSDLNPVEDEWGELKRRSCESEGSGVILDEGMVSDLGSGVLWPEPCRRWVRWTEEKKLWIWRSGVILDEGMISDLVSGVLWPEPWRRWVRWTEEKKLWIWRSGVILDEGMVSDLGSGVLWPEPCRTWVSELKRRSCESEDLEWFWMKEWSLISGQVLSDLNPVEDKWVNWREEAVNLKIWSDSGWRNGLWSRVRCSLTWTL